MGGALFLQVIGCAAALPMGRCPVRACGADSPRYFEQKKPLAFLGRALSADQLSAIAIWFWVFAQLHMQGAASSHGGAGKDVF